MSSAKIPILHVWRLTFVKHGEYGVIRPLSLGDDPASATSDTIEFAGVIDRTGDSLGVFAGADGVLSPLLRLYRR